MYHPEKVAARLEQAQKQLGWVPVYHSVEEVERLNRKLDSLAVLDKDGKPTGETVRPFTEDEKWWIRNERMLCACDASYFLTRYAFLKGDANEIVRFKFRNPQKVYFKIIAALEKRGAAIQLIVLKGRQLGVSTLTELLVIHRILFSYGVNAVVASSGQQQTQIMSNMIFLAYDLLPYWIKPVFTKRSESDKGQLVFGSIQTGVSFQHGSQTTGIARGHTPTVVHLSEVASFDNPEDLIDASLFRAVHESAGVFMVLESTAEGIDNWWHRKWKASKSGWAKGRSKLCPLFLPWFLGTEMYPKPVWLETRPLPDDWKPSDATKERMAKAKAFVASSPLLAEVLGDNWEMPLEQAWFSEVDFEEYQATGREKLWPQEMAGDDIECFQGSFDSVFGNDLIEELDKERKREFKIYGLKGHGIEDRYEPDKDDYDTSDEARRQIVRYHSNRGDSYSWEMIPLRRDVIDDEDDGDEVQAEIQADNKLLVFHDPQPGFDYTVGVDTSKGVGQDSTVISVWRKGMNGMPDVQVAEYASAYLPHVEAFAFVMVIAARYAIHMKDDQNREPLVSIEQIEAVGDICQIQMRKMGYARFNLFIRYDSKNLKKKDSNRMGWFTSGWSRPILVDGFVHSVKNSWAIINSPFLLRQMRKFEIHIKVSGRAKYEHSSGAHDDRIFAAAIAIHTSHDLESMIDRGKNRPVPTGVKHRPQIQLSPATWGSMDQILQRASTAKYVDKIKTTRDLEEYLASEKLMY